MNTPNVVYTLEVINRFLEDKKSFWRNLSIIKFETIIFSDEVDELNNKDTCNERLDTSTFIIEPGDKYIVYNNYYVLKGFILYHYHRKKFGPNMGLKIYIKLKK